MKILSENQSLKDELECQRGKEIYIITAFASATEESIDSLIKNNKKVSVIVGTINAYSSPNFLSHCAKKKSNKFNFCVDFRGDRSVHWKLYLISPNVVIIGSANFTRLGISLVRDTCVRIEDEELYKEYLKRFIITQNRKMVISSKENAFNKLFDEYSEYHKEQQRRSRRTTQVRSADDWLNDELDQAIPLLIWSNLHTKRSKEKAAALFEQEIEGGGSERIREFFVWEGGLETLPYSEGDVVLTVRENGQHLAWHTFDVILYHEGASYMYSLKKPRGKYFRPFTVGRLKSVILEKLPSWYQQDITEFSRRDLLDVIDR